MSDDVVINLDESQEEDQNVIYVTDCFGRKRTVEEIKERNQFREEVMRFSLLCVWIMSAIAFFITMVSYLPVKGYGVTEIFIISAIIVCIIVGIPLLVLIGCILTMIFNCCHDLI